MILRQLFLAIFIWSLPAISNGQSYFSTYETCSVNQGLVGNNVKAIVQDHQGYIWIATQSGVSRYDGFHYINFNHTTHSNFFEDDAVQQLILRGDKLLLFSSTLGCVEINTKTLRVHRKWRKGVSAFDFSQEATAVLFADNTLVVTRKGKKIKKKFKSSHPGSILLQKGDLYICFQDHTPRKISLMSLRTLKI